MEAVSRLKEEQSGDLVVFGSGVLVQSLMRGNLVDEYVLLIHPLVLGSGRRLFPDHGASAALTLRDTKTTSKGVVLVTYQAKRSLKSHQPEKRARREASTSGREGYLIW